MTQLRAEKRRLKRREKELEWQIGKSWKHLKETLRPEMIFKKKFREEEEFGAGKRDGNTILQTTLSYGAGLLARKLAKKAEAKLGKFFR